MDWFLSNAVGGIKLQVVEEDVADATSCGESGRSSSHTRSQTCDRVQYLGAGMGSFKGMYIYLHRFTGRASGTHHLEQRYIKTCASTSP